tara:strand:+ start:1773 stop:2546 length:774 start_codon:yes stop_codon:yes gene_type:complete
VINLNNIFKLFFLFFFYSCAVTTDVPKIIKKKSDVVKSDNYFKKKDISLSPLNDYELVFRASEKYFIDKNLTGINISHKKLPIPSVVRLSNPKDLNNFLIARNQKSNSNERFSVSNEIINLLQVKSNIYIEYLKDESLMLRKVDESKEESKIKMDSTKISLENLDDSQTGLSSQLDYGKIDSLEAKINKYQGMVMIGEFDDIIEAKLKTNKVKNLGLRYEEKEEKILVFAGPFNDNDINLKLDFLTKNGYSNAKLYP